jgi:hypothetical protein
MKNEPYKKINVSRPKDKSLKAYKSWMMEIAKLLTTDNSVSNGRKRNG